MRIKQTLLFLLFAAIISAPVTNAQTQLKAGLGQSKTNTYFPEQLKHLPPVSILKNLDANIKNIKPAMNENEVLKTLGLIQYKNHLKSNSFIRMDGAGGNWRVLLDDYNGYSLAFRDFMGHGNAKCMIRTPDRESWIDAKTSIAAVTTKELQDNLKRQMEKLQHRLAKQNESKNNQKSRRTAK